MQFDQNIHVMLERFDTLEMPTESSEEDAESSCIASFISEINSYDRDEINGKMYQRVEFSTRAVGKLLLAFDRFVV